MTPFLVAVMGVSAPTAVGTDLTFATLTKLTGSLQHFRHTRHGHHARDGPLVRRGHRPHDAGLALAGTLLPGGIPGVLVGSRLAPWIPAKPLEAILAAMLIFVGVRLLLA